jgi:elongation factor G
VAGVEVQTEKVWAFTNDYQLPRAVFINKLDRERSSFDRALASVQSNFGRTAIPAPAGETLRIKDIDDARVIVIVASDIENDAPIVE